MTSRLLGGTLIRLSDLLSAHAGMFVVIAKLSRGPVLCCPGCVDCTRVQVHRASGGNVRILPRLCASWRLVATPDAAYSLRFPFLPRFFSHTAQPASLSVHSYVFVYLGMAVFTFPIFDHTVWLLAVFGMLACFVGRSHIYIGSWLFNCFRTTAEVGDVQVGQAKISPAYMFVMWFSGLRGGVAFALASVSFANKDFPAHCGGLEASERDADPHCSSPGTNDSLAILQVTLLIAGASVYRAAPRTRSARHAQTY